VGVLAHHERQMVGEYTHPTKAGSSKTKQGTEPIDGAVPVLFSSKQKKITL
jgi:hypothetical protein